jgi:signal transduction histidine kinase
VVKDADNNILYYECTAEDITERKLAEEALKASREQLQALTAYLQNVREDERTQIAREIHDELGQGLTGLKMDISWLKNKLHNVKDMPQSIKEKIDSLLILTNTTIQSTRELVLKLRPSVLDDLGLIAALKWQARVFEERSGNRCTLMHKFDEQVVSRERATMLFRILQECLTNVARHAGATEVEIDVMQTGAEITMKIHDNGNGITDQAINDPTSFGLIGMRERVRLFKGDLSIAGSPERGTTVLVGIPIGST